MHQHKTRDFIACGGPGGIHEVEGYGQRAVNNEIGNKNREGFFNDKEEGLQKLIESTIEKNPSLSISGRVRASIKRSNVRGILALIILLSTFVALIGAYGYKKHGQLNDPSMIRVYFNHAVARMEINIKYSNEITKYVIGNRDVTVYYGIKKDKVEMNEVELEEIPDKEKISMSKVCEDFDGIRGCQNLAFDVDYFKEGAKPRILYPSEIETVETIENLCPNKAFLGNLLKVKHFHVTTNRFGFLRAILESFPITAEEFLTAELRFDVDDREKDKLSYLEGMLEKPTFRDVPAMKWYARNNFSSRVLSRSNATIITKVVPTFEALNSSIIELLERGQHGLNENAMSKIAFYDPDRAFIYFETIVEMLKNMSNQVNGNQISEVGAEMVENLEKIRDITNWKYLMKEDNELNPDKEKEKFFLKNGNKNLLIYLRAVMITKQHKTEAAIDVICRYQNQNSSIV